MSWHVVDLFDICRPKQWPTISQKDLLDSGYPVYGANGKIGYFSRYTHELETVLVTCRGATCGTINISEPQSYVNGNAMALDNLDTSKVDLTYLARYLEYRKLDDVISGSAQPQITRIGLQKVKIPLPPLEEQRRIAKVLSLADSLRQKARQMQTELDQLAQSLFLDMFGDPVKGTCQFPSKKLEEITERVTDGTHQSPKFQGHGIPFIFISNIVHGEISLDTKKYISEKEYYELTARCPIEQGDILYTTVGSYGNVAVVNSPEKFCFQRHIAHIKPKAGLVLPGFLHRALESNFVLNQAHKAVLGVAQKTLNLSALKKFQIVLPPLPKQEEFLSRYQYLHKTKSNVLETEKGLDQVFNSLLQQAFKGELTFNDAAFRALEQEAAHG